MNQTVHYRVRKGPLLVPILSQIHPVHSFQTYFPKIQSVISLPSTPVSSEWHISFRFSDRNFVSVPRLSHASYMPYPFHPPYPTNIWKSVQVVELLPPLSPSDSVHGAESFLGS